MLQLSPLAWSSNACTSAFVGRCLKRARLLIGLLLPLLDLLVQVGTGEVHPHPGPDVGPARLARVQIAGIARAARTQKVQVVEWNNCQGLDQLDVGVRVGRL